MISTETPTLGYPLTNTQPASQWAVGLDNQFRLATEQADLPLQWDRGHLMICLTANSFWIVYSFADRGKVAIRTCFDPQTLRSVKLLKKTKTSLDYQLEGALGRFRVRVELPDQQLNLLHYTTTLTPTQDFNIQAFPRDVCVLNDDYSPADEGQVYLTQSGPTAGLAYLSMTKPVSGTVLYFQNLTALNDYCQMTQSEPSGSVTAEWPELGFSLPQGEKPLVAGTDVVLSDAFVCLSEVIPQSEFDAADLFMEGVAAIYPHLPKPQTIYYDWPKAAQRTVDALMESPDCGRLIKGRFYMNAYVGASEKPPESMVQLAILVPLWEYQQWLGKPVPLVERLEENLPSFFERSKGTFMRWLPGESFVKGERSEEQDHNKIDSWYLLHTLMNLGRLAEKGNTQARDLLLRSVDFAIKAAHHFKYNWPVFYDNRNLNVIKAETEKGQGGELDVAGLYTHVMLQVYELTKETRFLEEAQQSAERLRGKGFALLYQSNITIMSALTLARLWKLTGNRLYYDLCRLSLANVVARLWMWECNFGFGQFYSTFMGVAPLKDAEYVAAYEEAEIFATIHSLLVDFGTDLSEATRLLLTEFMKYALHRGRFYFPAELPPDMLCQEPREGHIERDLPMPLEDISTGWKQAGAVGQEVYGGALAYIMTIYAYRQFADVPVIIFCEYPVHSMDYQLLENGNGYLNFRMGGAPESRCQIRLLAKSRTRPRIQLFDADGNVSKPIKPIQRDKTDCVYDVPGDARLRLEWEKKHKK